MWRDFDRRLAALEAKTKPPVISTWVDFVKWVDEHENDEGDLEIELSPKLQELVEMAAQEEEEAACKSSR